MSEQAVLDSEYLMTPAEVASIFRCSVDYIWRQCREGNLPHIRKGKGILVRRQDVVDWIAAQVREGR